MQNDLDKMILYKNTIQKLQTKEILIQWLDKMNLDKMTLDKKTLDKMTLDKMTLDKMTLCKMTQTK